MDWKELNFDALLSVLILFASVATTILVANLENTLEYNIGGMIVAVILLIIALNNYRLVQIEKTLAEIKHKIRSR